MKIGYRLLVSFTIVLSVLLIANPARHTQAQGTSCDMANAAWVGTIGYGLNCLDDAGWHSFDASSDITSAEGLAVCPDGVYFGGGLNIKKFDGQSSTDLPKDKWITMQNISCAEKGKIWVSYIEGVSVFDGSIWTNFEKQFGTGPFTTILKKVVAGPNGTAWVITTGSIAQYDGSKWTAYEKGKGLNDDYSFSDVMVDAKGNAWALASGSLLSFKDGKWATIKNKAINGATALASAADGKLWVGSTSGVASYDGKAWTRYDRKGSKLSSNSVRSIALDSQGRVWAGTDYGLNVFDGKAWATYLMSNSDISDNTVGTLFISGAGPKLPATKDKQPGSITGIIMAGKSPIAGATFELCTEFVGGIFHGTTPCGDNPFTASVKTNDKGEYTLDKVPVGRYGFVVQNTAGQWIQFIGLDTKIEVKEGQPTELQTLDISKVS